MRYGRLTTVGEEFYKLKGNQKRKFIHCICDCGKEKDIEMYNLSSGRTISCGCYAREVRSQTGQNTRSNNRYEIDGDIATVYDNSNNKFVIDAEDLSKIKPYYFRVNKYGYAVTCNSPKLHVHRIVANCPNDLFVDHINGNRCDNRKSNLRICNSLQNSWNRKRSIGAYKTKSGKWKCTISVNGVRQSLGIFNTKEEAIDAKIKALDKCYGEYSPAKYAYIKEVKR